MRTPKARRDPQILDAINCRYLSLDDERVANPLRGLAIDTWLDEPFSPRVIGPIHGDLHFGNILWSAGTFVLIDPRGEFGSHRSFDPAYDVAKLLHESTYLASVLEVADAASGMTGDTLKVVQGPIDLAASRRLDDLAKVSVSTAHRLADELAVRDPFIAGRATLYVGLLLLTVLAFDAPRDWGLLVLQAASWLRAGRLALDTGMSRHEVSVIWRDLTSSTGASGLWALTQDEHRHTVQFVGGQGHEVSIRW